MSPSRPVRPEQVTRTQLALCRRLGLNPSEVSNIDWSTAGDDLARLDIIAWLPREEVIEAFNLGEVTGAEPVTADELAEIMDWAVNNGPIVVGEDFKVSTPAQRIATVLLDRFHVIPRKEDA